MGCLLRLHEDCLQRLILHLLQRELRGTIQWIFEPWLPILHTPMEIVPMVVMPVLHMLMEVVPMVVMPVLHMLVEAVPMVVMPMRAIVVAFVIHSAFLVAFFHRLE